MDVQFFSFKPHKKEEIQVPLLISYSAQKAFLRETGKEWEALDDTEVVEMLEIMIWYGIEFGYRRERVKNPLDREEDLPDIMDTCIMQLYRLIPLFGLEEEIPQETQKAIQKPKPKPKPRRRD